MALMCHRYQRLERDNSSFEEMVGMSRENGVILDVGRVRRRHELERPTVAWCRSDGSERF